MPVKRNTLHLFWIFFGILVWSGLNSCSSTRQFAAQSPEIVLDKFLSYDQPISYASKLKLWINLRTGEKARTELFVYSRRAEEYSFYLKDFWGRDMMTALIQKDSIIVFYPQENQYLQASIEDFTRSDYWLWQISPLTLLKAVDGTLLDGQASINFVGQNDGAYEYRVVDQQYQMLFSLSPKNNSLKRIMLYESSGKLLAEIQWGNIRLYKGYLRPRLVKIKMGDYKDEIKLGIMEEKFDLELKQKYFNLPIPPDVQRLNLN